MKWGEEEEEEEEAGLQKKDWAGAWWWGFLNVWEKQIKFLGRWTKIKGNEKSIIEATKADQLT